MAESATPEQKVIVVDFGAQYGQLIARRVRDLHVYSEIVPCDIMAEEVRAIAPAAIILSGGPASVYAEDAPSIDPEILALGIPVLGFCYGQQAMAVALGGEVGHTEKGEYGPLEQALIGVPVADIEKPINALRTVHSFDPCTACAVHVTERGTGKHFETVTSPWGVK